MTRPGPGLYASGVHLDRKMARAGFCALAVLAAVASRPVRAQQISEAFDNVPALFSSGGWVQVNHSNPGPTETPTTGLSGFAQGFAPYFGAQAGATGSEYAQVSWRSTTSLGSGTISNWMITPVLNLYPGVQVTFYTRTFTSPHADHLEVRMSTNGNSTNVGTLATDVGDFTTVLLDINPALAGGGFPTAWTQETVTLTAGQVPVPTTGRLAFRYFVTGAGAGNGPGANGNYVGIDTLTVTPVTLSRFDAE